MKKIKILLLLIFSVTIFTIFTEKVSASITYIYMHFGNNMYRTCTYQMDCSLSSANTIVFTPSAGWEQIWVGRENCTWQGWYSDESYSQLVSSYQIPPNTTEVVGYTIGTYSQLNSVADSNGVVHLYSKWSCPVTCSTSWSNSVTVKFNTNGGTSMSNQKSTYGSNTLLNTGTTKDGYYFDGWYKNNNYTSKVTKISDISFTQAKDSNNCTIGYNAATVYAKWSTCPYVSSNHYNLIYDTNGGSSISSTEVNTTTDSLTSLPTPTKTGYIFKGWFLDSALTNEATLATLNDETGLTETKDANSCSTGQYSSRTIYAKWAKSYKITINPNGGTYNGQENPSPIELENGSVYNVSNPSKTNYNFTEWTASPSSAYSSSKVTINGSDVTLTANWQIITHTLTINPGGGNYDGHTQSFDVTVNQGSVYNLKTPTKPNYTFDGWEITPTSTYNSSNGNLTIGTSNITVQAKWKNIKRTLTINPNGGVYKNKTTSFNTEVNQGEQITISTPTKDGGYDFGGWTVTPNGSYNESTRVLTVPASNVTLIANWTNKTCPSYTSGTYILEYETNGGNSLSVSIVNFPNGNNEQLPTPTKENYIFDGWYFDSALTQKVDSRTTMVTTTPKAIIENWCPTNSYENITIYAKWKVDESKIVDNKNYGKIIFNTNGGSAIADINQNVIETNPLKELPKPTKTGYIFRGWYYDSALTQKVNTNLVKDLDYKTTSVTNGLVRTITYENMPLYAKWVLKSEYCQPITNKNIKIEKLNYATILNGGKNNHLFDDIIEVEYPYSDTSKQIIQSELFTYDSFTKNYIKGGATHNRSYEIKKTYKDSDYANEITYANFITLTPEYEYNDEGCEIGYATIKLYQKSNLTCESGTLLNVIFHSNGGQKIDDIVASNINNNWNTELPTPTKEDSEFVGWYYDPEFKHPVDAKTIAELDYKNDLKYDNVGCQDGWNDKHLYAKWNVKNSKTGSFAFATIVALVALLGGILLVKFKFKKKIYKI